MPVGLWTARLERPLTERESERLLALLPPQRRERLLRVKDPERRREPLCAYLLLQLALWETYGWKKLPEMSTTSQGKPLFPEHPDVHFNLSHTGGAVMVGVSDQPIGVDIERIRPVSLRSMQRLAGVSTEEAFFQCWVRREARAKRSGTGVGTMLRSETPLQYGEYYYEIETFPGYAAGAATRSREAPGQIRRFSLDELT